MGLKFVLRLERLAECRKSLNNVGRTSAIVDRCHMFSSAVVRKGVSELGQATWLGQP